jgi:Tol biopolymer transport system component
VSARTDITERFSAALASRYRIERLLGSGGMATVFLANDIKHARQVALKVLKPDLALAVGAERFLAEIRTTANLQHPHILSLFDSGEVEGTAFYVMPFVEGESLRDRITREGALPVAEATRIAREVADALEYAHRKGVIHRDIKPENILLGGATTDGRGSHALVADFGIALAISKTASHRLTETGISLGTPAYMSPEQAMGERILDARTDVYALGSVLYEMLTGEPPFAGPTAQAIVSRILTEEPRSLLHQRRTVPQAVASAVDIALSKMPADRFSTAAAFADALSPESVSGARQAERYVEHRTGRISKVTIALGAALALTAAAAVWGWMRPAPAAPVTRSYLKFPDAEAPIRGRRVYTLLPDGSAIVYVGRSGAGGTQLWMKKRSELHATPIGGTTGATSVFVSPDGQWIGFIADAQLRKVPTAGGEATTLTNATCNSIACLDGTDSGTWLDDGHIVFIGEGGMLRIPAGGGRVDSLSNSAANGGLAPILPVALPGSRGVVFTACTLYCNNSNVRVFDFAKRETRLLIDNAMLAQYSPTGHLVYVDAAGRGMAIPFDATTLQTSGTATPILDRVADYPVVSSNGTLAYLEGDNAPRSELVFVGRDGRIVQSLDSTWRANFATLALSNDGQRLAASIVDAGQEHLWMKAIGGPAPVRLTVGRSQSTTPAWTSDGQSLLFTRFDGSRVSTFMRKGADGGAEQVLQSGDNWVIEVVTSRDGEWIVTRQYRPGGKRDIYARRTRGDTTERAIIATPTDDVSPSLSPDAKWIAYANNEAGSREVWVSPFPDQGGARWQVSTQGGFEPTWSPAGDEVFYVTPKLDLVAVEVSTANGFRLGSRRVLFNVAGYRRHLTHRAYEVTPDGKQFIMIRQHPPASGDLVIVDNWFSDLAARLK